MATLYHTWIPRMSRASVGVRSPRAERSASVSVPSMRKKAKSKNRPEKSMSSPFSTSPKLHALVEAGAKPAGDCDAILESPFGRSSSPAIRTKLHCYQPREVAEELCLMDAKLLRKIQPEEMEHGAWMKADKKNLAPNILAMVHASNNLAMLVPTEILAETSPQTMSKVIVHFIMIASYCYRLHNFNSLKAILAGLQCTPVYRLKKTWKEVPAKYRKKFDGLCHLMSEEFNYREYRRVLDEALDNNTPCIPFLGVLLTTIVQCSSHNYGLGSRKYSGVEDYTVMEAVTVRNRLERLRKRSSVMYSRSHLVSSGTCQIIEEESVAKKTKPGEDWATEVAILEGGVTNSSSNPAKCLSPTLEILEPLPADGIQTEDEVMDNFRRRSNCLNSKTMKVSPQFKGDSEGQAEGDSEGQAEGDSEGQAEGNSEGQAGKADNRSKEEMQSESDILLTLSDISLDLESDKTATSRSPCSSADHAHMELLDDIRLQEVIINDKYIQDGGDVATKSVKNLAKKRRNGTIENTFVICPSNDSLCSGNGSDCISSSSLESVGMETGIRGVNGFMSISSISSITSVSSTGMLDRSPTPPTPQDTEVATIDFLTESEKDSQPTSVQEKSINTSRPLPISRCASDRKAKLPHSGRVSASIHESVSYECIRDVMKAGAYDLAEDSSVMDMTSSEISMSIPTTSCMSSDDDEVGEVEGDSECSSSSSSSSPEPITPSTMSSPDSMVLLARYVSAPVGCPDEPSPKEAFSATTKRNTWQSGQLQLATELTTDYHKKESEPQQRGSKVAAKKSRGGTEKGTLDKVEEEEFTTGPVRRRSRRKASKVLSVALAPSMKIKNWSLVLTRYQIMSLGCSDKLTSQPFLRSLIVKYSLNPDSLNYKLSHAREPNH